MRRRPVWHLIVGVLVLIVMVLVFREYLLEKTRIDWLTEHCTSITVGECTKDSIHVHTRRSYHPIEIPVTARYSVNGQNYTTQGVLRVKEYKAGDRVEIHYYHDDPSQAYAGRSPHKEVEGYMILSEIAGSILLGLMIQVERKQH